MSGTTSSDSVQVEVHDVHKIYERGSHRVDVLQGVDVGR
jgi:hypothetical protein